MRAIPTKLAGAGLFCAALSGCAGFWDEVSSKDFSMRNMVSPPEPMSVLRTSTDGDARAKAIRRLEEPARTGAPQQQDEVVKLLTDTALGDKQPICRMAAISTLGRFQDPRAVPALVNAYESANQLSPEIAFMVRCQTLTALGETKQPAAVEFLTKVAKEPSKSDATNLERGQNRDVRIAAVRALRNFPSAAAAAETTAQLAQGEKDVAVRDRAKETFVTLTGRDPANTPPSSPTLDTTLQAVKHEQPTAPR